jgi:hypothetical protein
MPDGNHSQEALAILLDGASFERSSMEPFF